VLFLPAQLGRPTQCAVVVRPLNNLRVKARLICIVSRVDWRPALAVYQRPGRKTNYMQRQQCRDVVSGRQEIWANAHETRDSISLISYAGCLGLSPVYFSVNSLLSVHRSLKWQKNHLKPILLGFKVVQGHRCWYSRKARRQCLLWYAASLCLSATILLLD